MNSDRAKTGILELDQMSRGGFIRGDTVLLAGYAGCGKTTLALQFLVNGATQFGESGIMVTFEQMPDQIYRDALNFGWNLRQLEQTNRLRIICTSPDLMTGEGATALLDGPIRDINASRIVIDSASHLEMFVPQKEMRLEAYRLVNYLKAKGLTTLLTSESHEIFGGSLAVTGTGISFLVDCVILLKYVEIESSMKKAIITLKMRGSDHDKSLRECTIRENGFVVESQFEDYESILSGTPRRVEQTARKLKDWLMQQPIKVTARYFDQLCSEILSIDSVRYCAVRDAFANILAGGQKPGIIEIETELEKQDSPFRTSLLSSLLASSPASFGKSQVLSIEFDRLKIMVFPLGQGNILLVKLKPDTPVADIETIRRVITRVQHSSA